MTPEQHQEILNLRSLNLTPKQIARKLGLKNAEVATFLRGQAEQTTLAQQQGGLDPVDRCLVNANIRRHFFPKADGTEPVSKDIREQSVGGLALVTVVRKRGYNRFTLCTYPIDLGCLGVKDAQGPRQVNGSECKQVLAAIYQAFDEPPQAISLEQAQAIVFSAVDYAQKLGFPPHANFDPLRDFLGEWDPNNQIPCGGKDGKPLFFCGPYDNLQAVIDTLTRSVGEGNFEVILPGEVLEGV
ncbi:hypothetical protein [Trichothermofontia sp.]